MKKLGIFGGTFDPIHNGHVELAKAALIEANLDFVFFMPTKRNPFKKDNDMASDLHRVNMIKSTINNKDYFCLLEKELEDDEYSYTYDTLSALNKEYTCCETYFIVGTDSILTMENWYKGKELLSEFSFITCNRPGHSMAELEDKLNYYKRQYGANILLLKSQMTNISSTNIRDKIKQGKSIKDDVPEGVERYILENDLYK